MAKVCDLLSGKRISTVLLFLFFTGACSSAGSPPEAGQPQGVPVKLQSVDTSTVEESSEFVGTLEAEQSVVLRPETDGRVSQIFVSSGSRVGVRTPIVQLRPDKGQAQVGGAIADVNAAKGARNNAEAQLKAVQAERESAIAELDLQNEQFRRISSLVSQGALAKQQLDQVKRDRDAARAALNAVEERIRAARATLDQENSSLSSAQASATLRSEELQDTKVVAPIAGQVGDVTVKLGDYVKAGDTLTTITQNNSLNLRLSIPVERASELRIGLPVQLRDSQENSQLSTGRISFVSPQVDAKSQAILAKASFPNPQGNLRDGQFVRAKVVWKRRLGSVVVPTTAVIFQGEERFIYVANTGEKPVVRRQKVQLGTVQGDKTEVRQGLQAGDKIVISGSQKLADGAPIIPLPAEQSNQKPPS